MNRRDFLKGASLLPITPLLDRVCEITPSSASEGKPNIIIILFDALSARHISLYGYRRETTPNLAKFAEQATVYHSHYAAGNFTTPGTTSLLTGTYPWTHRALHLTGKMGEAYEQRSIFKLFGDEYNTIAYPHNMAVHLLLNQLKDDVDNLVDPAAFSLFDDMSYRRLLPGDINLSFRSFEDLLLQNDGLPASLFLSLISEGRTTGRLRSNLGKLIDNYPRGIPVLCEYRVYFLVEDIISGLLNTVNKARQPLLAYLHFFPPHDPYRPRREFIGTFDDEWEPLPKDQHPLSEGFPNDYLNQQRTHYDEFIAHVDAEFGRMYESLKENGLTRNSYIILTSDHGELFERGVRGHNTPLMYEPVIRVPLLISRPGQQEREDVHTPTNCVDLLPTLLHGTGRRIPDWCEGEVLPGLGGAEDSGRSVFSVEAKENPAHAPLRHGTVAMIRGRYKLIHYFGYSGYEDQYELYNLENDPEEMDDLYTSKRSIAADLRAQLKAKLEAVNRSYSA